MRGGGCGCGDVVVGFDSGVSVHELDEYVVGGCGCGWEWLPGDGHGLCDGTVLPELVKGQGGLPDVLEDGVDVGLFLEGVGSVVGREVVGHVVLGALQELFEDGLGGVPLFVGGILCFHNRFDCQVFSGTFCPTTTIYNKYRIIFTMVNEFLIKQCFSNQFERRCLHSTLETFEREHKH